MGKLGTPRINALGESKLIVFLDHDLIWKRNTRIVLMSSSWFTADSNWDRWQLLWEVPFQLSSFNLKHQVLVICGALLTTVAIYQNNNLFIVSCITGTQSRIWVPGSPVQRARSWRWCCSTHQNPNILCTRVLARRAPQTERNTNKHSRREGRGGTPVWKGRCARRKLSFWPLRGTKKGVVQAFCDP